MEADGGDDGSPGRLEARIGSLLLRMKAGLADILRLKDTGTVGDDNCVSLPEQTLQCRFPPRLPPGRDRCELYSRSRRSNRPISPGIPHASACCTTTSGLAIGRSAIAPSFSGTLRPLHHSHLRDSKEEKLHPVGYVRFDVRSVVLPYHCYMDKGNCLSIWQWIG